jgi:hypothetical protein
MLMLFLRTASAQNRWEGISGLKAPYGLLSFKLNTFTLSQNSSGLRALQEKEYFSLLLSAQTGLETHPASYPVRLVCQG